MPSVIGKIISFEGAFSIKGLDGSVRKALLGDNIYEGEVLIGDKNNTPLNNIEISISDASTIVIRGQEKQLFDASLATREFTKEETITQKDSIEAMLEASGDLEEIQELETAAGEEVVTESSGTAEAAFAELNNASVNVSADLRQRAFDANDGFNN
ncbi:MAG: cell shape-determining protein MreD, partial [Sulfurimonas sp.]|nr:cell shape-determining protein MreD [Sulfurimonas sp.]